VPEVRRLARECETGWRHFRRKVSSTQSWTALHCPLVAFCRSRIPSFRSGRSAFAVQEIRSSEQPSTFGREYANSTLRSIEREGGWRQPRRRSINTALSSAHHREQCTLPNRSERQVAKQPFGAVVSGR